MPSAKAIVERIKLLSKEVDETKKQATTQLQTIKETAVTLSAQKTEVLFGITGGAIGTLGGLVATATIASLSAVAVVPISMGLGIAIGLLIFRGQSGITLDQAIRMYQEAIAAIRAEIKSLPADAPQAARDSLWAEHTKLTETLGNLSRAKLTGNKQALVYLASQNTSALPQIAQNQQTPGTMQNQGNGAFIRVEPQQERIPDAVE